MGNACKKNAAKQPKRAAARELEEKKRKDEEEREDRLAREAAAAEEEERARIDEQNRLKAEEEMRRLAEEEERRLEEARRAQQERLQAEAEAQARAEAASEAAMQSEHPSEEVDPSPQGEPRTEETETLEAPRAPEPVDVGDEDMIAKLSAQEDEMTKTTEETTTLPKKFREHDYGKAAAAPRGRTITPCDMTNIDETSKYMSRRCGCHISDEHDENNCPICRCIDLSDAPLLN